MDLTPKLRLTYMLTGSLLLTACTAPVISPVEQMEMRQKPESLQASQPKVGRTVVKKQSLIQYRCKQKKLVQIQTEKAKKNATITLTFGQISHKLSSAVTKTGKKYSNIRWTWTEDFQGIGTLRDNRNNRLAEHCIKQGA